MVTYVGSLALSQMVGTLIPADTVDPIARWFDPSAAEPAMMRASFLYWIIVSVGLSATVYGSVGGFRAAIWNDVLQSVMLFGGTVMTLGYVIWTTGTGPVEWWNLAAENSAGHTKPILFSFDPTVSMTVVTAAMLNFFWVICAPCWPAGNPAPAWPCWPFICSILRTCRMEFLSLKMVRQLLNKAIKFCPTFLPTSCRLESVA